jgi:hypothetical protein
MIASGDTHWLCPGVLCSYQSLLVVKQENSHVGVMPPPSSRAFSANCNLSLEHTGGMLHACILTRKARFSLGVIAN